MDDSSDSDSDFSRNSETPDLPDIPPNVTPSIVTAEPQGDLFPILPFALNFHKLVQEQKDHDPYYEYFSDRDQEREVEQRCDVTEDFEEANQIFADPTVFGLLKEWHDGKIVETKEHDPTLRPTWSSVFGQADDINEYGDPSNLHLKDFSRPSSNSDHILRRLLSSPARGRKRIPYDNSRATRHSERLKSRSTISDGNRKRQRTSSPVPEATDTDQPHDPSASTSTATANVPLSPSDVIVIPDPSTSSVAESTPTSVLNYASSTTHSSQRNTPAEINDSRPNEPNVSAKTKNPMSIKRKDIAMQKIHDQEDALLLLERAEERAAVESHFVKTTFETNFQKYSLMIDDCKLRTLSEGARFELPVTLRPPVNYVGIQRASSNTQRQPILGTETIVSVAFYSSLRPSQRTEEYLFLGSQPLTAIRDAFYCLHDFTTRGADEPPLDAPTRNTTDRKVSNSFLFIEGVFYSDSPLIRAKIDRRNELKENERRRLSELAEKCRQRYMDALNKRKEIRRGKMRASSTQTLENSNSRFSKTSRQGDTPEDEGEDEDEDEDEEVDYDDSDLREQMRNTEYRDQSIEEIELENEEEYANASLDYSQIFNPEHDEQNRHCYPKPIFKSKKIRHKCRMCNANQAFYVTLDDRLAGETPCYFCKQCYDAFHYDVDGNILYDDFRVFEYTAFEGFEGVDVI
ncbi:small nuclear RNA activating complex, polypeptide 3 [Mortierella sp. AM989]|nr:small nuclear RNA activating complex, polypeptide 3 [Mortierella sp. AM989]